MTTLIKIVLLLLASLKDMWGGLNINSISTPTNALHY